MNPETLDDLLAVTRRYVQDVIVPNASAWERGRRYPADAIRAAASIGLNRIEVATERGGLGMRFGAKLAVARLLAAEDMAIAFAIVNAHNATSRMARDGTPAQRERWLPRLLSGESVGAVCLTEPGAGSDFPAIATRARRTGDAWVLDGEKAWVTNGVIADHALVYAQTDAAAGRRGIAGYLVALDDPGVERVPAELLYGGHAIGAAGIRMRDVRLAADRLFYPPGDAFRRAMGSINGARTYVAGMCGAMLARAISLAVGHAHGREAFGEPLWAKQGLRWMLADAQTDLEALELLTERAATLVEAGEDAAAAAAHAKKFAARVTESRLRDCAQILGAGALRDVLPFGRFLAAARIAHYVDGTTEIQNERIAAALAAMHAR